MSNHTAALFVQDMNCSDKFPRRAHDVLVDGEVITYEFKVGEKVEMPFAHAVKLIITGFEVTDKAGKAYNAPGGQQRDSDKGIVLRAGEVVANLEEINVDALVIRCNQISGGEMMTKRSGRATLIAFLVANQIDSSVTASFDGVTAGRVIVNDGDDDLIGDNMTADELAEELPGSD